MENTNQTVKFLDPTAIIAQLEIEQGSRVADFGCGPGFFSIPFAQKIGELGKVYALDVLTTALEAVESKAKNLGIVNIETKRVNLEKAGGSKLDDQSCDWVILKDMLFQNQHKEVIIEEVKRVLKSNGQVLVIEWNEVDAGIGPDAELRISQENLQALFDSQGFEVAKQITAGGFHYAFIALKKA